MWLHVQVWLQRVPQNFRNKDGKRIEAGEVMALPKPCHEDELLAVVEARRRDDQEWCRYYKAKCAC